VRSVSLLISIITLDAIVQAKRRSTAESA